MTIGLRVAGSTTAAAGAVTPLQPVVGVGAVVGDLSLCLVQGKHATVGVAPTVSTPTASDGSTWALVGTVTNNGLLAPGIDTGSNTVAIFRSTDATAGATLSITTTGMNSASAGVITLSTTLGGTWDTSQTTTGDDTTLAANGSITGLAGIDVATGDWVFAAGGASGDAGTATPQTIAGMTGATLGATVLHYNAGVTTNMDSRALASSVPVTAGASNVAPTFAYTNASSTTSHVRFIRVREVAPATAVAAIPPRRAPQAVNRAGTY